MQRNPKYQFVWLSLEENLVWCTDLMGTNKFGEFPPGSVIAFNGARKYFYLYRPNRTKVQLKKGSPQISPEFLGLEDDSDEENVGMQHERSAKLMQAELPSWLDRLMDGTLPSTDKKRVDSWPQMDKLD